MKICFLIDSPMTLGGGPEHIRKVKSILESKYNCTVDVVSPMMMDKNFKFDKFAQRVKFAFWVLKFLFTSSHDIYIGHAFSADFFLPLVKLRGKKAGITVHGAGVNLIGVGILEYSGLPQLGYWLILHVWPFDFKMSAGSMKGFVTVGNGVDVTEFDKEKAKPDPNYFTILCISRNDPVKGINILEAAVNTVKARNPNVKLNLITGRRRTAKDFKTANLYVLPSLSEGLPIVLLEAMAAKLPIITTDVGDCRRLIESAGSGIVIQPGNSDLLAQAIGRIIGENLLRLGENGYNFVKKNYSWDEVGRKVAKTIGLTMIKRGTK